MACATLEDINGRLVFNEDIFSNAVFQKFVRSIEKIDEYRRKNGK